MNSPSARADIARYLVERGATADIFLAAALGLDDRARELLAADPSLLSRRTTQGDYGEQGQSSFHIYQWTLGANLSPLQVAAERGQKATLAVMEQFASPAEKLLLACHLGKRDAAHAIVRDHPGIVEQLGPVERRALANEAWRPNVAAVELMLELGFDPSIERIDGGNALHCAAWEGSVPCVAAILRHPSGRALVNSIEGTYQGTPLSWCCHGSGNCGNPRADHGAVARLLIEAGATAAPDILAWGCSEAMTSALADALRDRPPS